MTDIQPYLDRVDITLTEYPEDPWGRLEGPVFHVRADWKHGELIANDEMSMHALGRGQSRDEATQDFRKKVALNLRVLEEVRRLRAVRDNPTSIERVEL